MFVRMIVGVMVCLVMCVMNGGKIDHGEGSDDEDVVGGGNERGVEVF